MRRLLAGLPDGARILPDWEGDVPNDDEPGVRLGLMRVRQFTNGEKYLSVGVELFYPDEDRGEESCAECGVSVAHGTDNYAGRVWHATNRAGREGMVSLIKEYARKGYEQTRGAKEGDFERLWGITFPAPESEPVNPATQLHH